MRRLAKGTSLNVLNSLIVPSGFNISDILNVRNSLIVPNSVKILDGINVPYRINADPKAKIFSQAKSRTLSQKINLAPFVMNPLPSVPIPRPVDKRPFAKRKDVVKVFEALTAQKHKSPAGMATASPASTNSVITGKTFNPVAGAFLPQALGQIAPKVITDTVTSIPEPAPAIANNVQEEIRYPKTPAFGSIPSLAPGLVSKSGPAMPLETPAKVICRPDIETSASDELGAASVTPLAPATPATRVVQTALEPAVTPFTRVLMEIQKNLGDLRDIAKGFNVVNAVEVCTDIQVFYLPAFK